MKIFIKSCLSGVKQARGLVVIIDVISASSTIVNLFEAGVKAIIPVSSLKKAREMREKNRDYLLCSESRYRLSGIDLVNSPIISTDVGGKTILMKTDAGTRGILEAKKAAQVIVGCFLNCQAIVNYIKTVKPVQLTLVPMGSGGKKPAIEDELCALYIKGLLEGKKVNFEDVKKKIITGSAKNILRYLTNRKKLIASLSLNTSKTAPVLVGGSLQSFKSKAS
ncbi:MAG: 2-phosphosulfolactate phosphatase [Candidatus Aenigmarchaeota archaeon]|nr:2-phosphosulfolactate phosphatase [Candidatus Aenigmarchaeota archaeon]